MPAADRAGCVPDRRGPADADAAAYDAGPAPRPARRRRRRGGVVAGRAWERPAEGTRPGRRAATTVTRRSCRWSPGMSTRTRSRPWSTPSSPPATPDRAARARLHRPGHQRRCARPRRSPRDTPAPAGPPRPPPGDRHSAALRRGHPVRPAGLAAHLRTRRARQRPRHQPAAGHRRATKTIPPHLRRAVISPGPLLHGSPAAPSARRRLPGPPPHRPMPRRPTA